MKNWMGLVVAVALGTATFAQDTQNENYDDNNTSSAKFREKSALPGDASGKENKSEEVDAMYGAPSSFKTGKGVTNMQRFDNGSVYYFDSPTEGTEMMTPEIKRESRFEKDISSENEMNLENEDAANAEENSLNNQDLQNEDNELIEGDAADASEALQENNSSQGSIMTPQEVDPNAEARRYVDSVNAVNPDEVLSESESTKGEYLFGTSTTCSLNSILNSRDGDFKLKQDGENEALKIEREKDGDATIKYDSENEYYRYKENGKGESEYVYSLGKGDEVIEIYKNKDGSGDVVYHGHFNNLDDAKVLNEGFNFENVESACNLNR
jgi:hypothetical protein